MNKKTKKPAVEDLNNLQIEEKRHIFNQTISFYCQ